MPTTGSSYSIAKRLASFRYAISGIGKYLRSEPNAQIHLLATIVVAIAAWLLKVSTLEAAALTAAIGLVWLAEMLNTCIEKIMDFISEEKDTRIQFIKDIAAGAVLVSAGVAVVIGLFIFIPKLI